MWSSAIASEISRRIYSSASLSEPAPFVAGAPLAPSAQALIEDAINRDPLLITLAFHVTPPWAQTNSIVASSFGRIGKVADADDERVMREGATLRELTNGGKRLAIELPLLDARGRVVGALSTSFRIDPKADLDRSLNARLHSGIRWLARSLRSTLCSVQLQLQVRFAAYTTVFDSSLGETHV